MSHKGLTWKVFFLIVFNDMMNSFGQLFMKKGIAAPAAPMTNFQALFDFLSANIGSGFMWLGIAIYILGFFIWIIILARVELSIAMPIASTDYVIVPLLAIFFLKETVSPLRWIGILTIMLGIYLVSQSGKRRAAIAVGGAL